VPSPRSHLDVSKNCIYQCQRTVDSSKHIVNVRKSFISCASMDKFVLLTRDAVQQSRKAKKQHAPFCTVVPSPRSHLVVPKNCFYQCQRTVDSSKRIVTVLKRYIYCVYDDQLCYKHVAQGSLAEKWKVNTIYPICTVVPSTISHLVVPKNCFYHCQRTVDSSKRIVNVRKRFISCASMDKFVLLTRNAVQQSRKAKKQYAPFWTDVPSPRSHLVVPKNCFYQSQRTLNSS
jgi:hypothetical protein